MGVRILNGDGQGDSQGAVLYDSTSGWAFGPIFADSDAAERFVEWLRETHGNDPRQLSDVVLGERFAKWRIESDSEVTA